MVSRVQTWIDNDVLGDMRVDVSYTVYKDFGGVKFPTMIVQNQGGFPVLILGVNAVKANPAINIQSPPLQTATAASATVQTEKVFDGVYYLKGGTHHSVAVEFADYVALIEAPLNESRSLAVIAELKKLIPGKSIRYVVNTHHHFDHAGGLRTYVNEGATIVTHQINKDFFERAFAAARSLNPDRLEQSKKKANIEVVGDKKVITDGNRSLELHAIKDSPHNDGLLLAFLPKEKLMIEGDVYTPSAVSPAAANPATVNLVDNLERLRLDFETIVPLHGPGRALRTDLYAAIQKRVPDMAQLLKAPLPVETAGQRGQRGQRGQAPAADPAAQLLSSACTGCHSVARIQTKKADEDEWSVIVDRMKGKGAELSDEETRVLVEYLAKTYK
jgi:glyoxylase-like metal-dependent hydrolase (beta-lactamase superfamily II)